MLEFGESFLLAFIPLFVAIDALGILPIFVQLTEGLPIHEKKNLVTQATLAALILSLLFLLTGKLLFSFLGISENDFRIAGGIVILLIAIKDLTSHLKPQRDPVGNIGVVPIGIPLIVGPAALTTLLILVDSYGSFFTVLSILVNLLIVWVVFQKADLLVRLMGEAGSRAFAKVMSLFLAAIAVMMIRVGIFNFLGIS